MGDYPLAVVTGGAHRIGRVFATTLARHGYAVLLHYHHSLDEAVRTEDEIRAFGTPVFKTACDLTDTAEVNDFFLFVDSLSLPLQVLVNSAGKMAHVNLKKITIPEWDSTLNLNLRAPMLMANYAAQRMTTGGLIVNISDAGVHQAWTGYPAYTISKTGLDELTRLQAKTYAPLIRVNAIAPGLALPSPDLSSDEWNRLVDRLPLKKPVALEDLSLTLEFLLQTKTVTGQTIVVDGGYSLI